MKKLFCFFSCRFLFFSALLFFTAGLFFQAVYAFKNRDVLFLHVGIPALEAGLKAYRENKPVLPFVIQALAGGFLMKHGFEIGAKVDERSPWKAFRAKVLVNMGSSIIESIGKRFSYRMDVGPFWLISDFRDVRIHLGLHSTIAPIVNLIEGAKFDPVRSL
ncbi:hypothetical protein HYY75_04850, partial [bacterium]|nr:hypothetical protein [bacterium]